MRRWISSGANPLELRPLIWWNSTSRILYTFAAASESGGQMLEVSDQSKGQPSYLRLLQTGELARRVTALETLLERCTVCPRDCLNNRLRNEIAACYSGRLPIVSSYTAHFGEEPALVGTRGAGNIFFGNCNLRCVYCQNYQISQTHKEQLKNEITHERLAEIMLELQARGCHNINFVSPTHFAPQTAPNAFVADPTGSAIPAWAASRMLRAICGAK